MLNDAQKLKMIGILSLCLGGFIALFLFLPNTWNARLCIAAVAVGILGVGAFLFTRSQKVS